MQRNQEGLIQGALLIALALLAVLIGALSIAGNGRSTNVSEEKAKVLASVILKQSADIQDAFQRAVATGGIDPSSATIEAVYVTLRSAAPRPPVEARVDGASVSDFKWGITRISNDGKDVTAVVLPLLSEQIAAKVAELSGA